MTRGGRIEEKRVYLVILCQVVKSPAASPSFFVKAARAYLGNR